MKSSLYSRGQACSEGMLFYTESINILLICQYLNLQRSVLKKSYSMFSVRMWKSDVRWHIKGSRGEFSVCWTWISKFFLETVFGLSVHFHLSFNRQIEWVPFKYVDLKYIVCGGPSTFFLGLAVSRYNHCKCLSKESLC